MIKKLLIANRGEIAVRVIRAAKELGIKTVAIYSEVDKDCLHTILADEKICIGPGPATESYLSIPNIISACEATGADAIHPGYGFLSENTYFAEVCEACNITFVGPSKESIEKMGDKIEAKRIAKKAGVPVVPGIEEEIKDPDDPELIKEVKKIGFPVIIKAALGGGGKGMRIVNSEESLKIALLTAMEESKKAFGSDKVYIEKYIEEPKHIEIQILADKKGNIVYFPERDCSIQRRHQKLIEESPCPMIDEKLRKKIGRAAAKLAEEINYYSAGTVEFIMDKKGNFYFMEMNTRIQVEHPVTELVSVVKGKRGLDLVKEQILIASGEKIKFSSEDIAIGGHSIECRINAEDPDKDFLPSPGKIENLILPGGNGVRIDTHIYSGYTIPTFYDSLIAKLIVIGSNRQEAIRKMLRALDEFKISGIKTTIPFHKKVLQTQAFMEGDVYTNFLQKYIYEQI
ncbi:MAG: acetyl-CoA carboxylase biotin carboxylase subunit [Elusimicrobiota bacterium]|nr:acetyl-CoA carboxylase biotin carboxylase subunit [Endomicrobiia bacterium]MCX7910659.1 acetyl-CoA carboxylase biotin carboxylase subunit [Endomicrobiia bacterium]MDW8166210.1 acetyl-CoA carboxylase biotin carboxylase subunit [Elusimicrobiota bacterium]